MRTARGADEPVNSAGSSVAELFRDGLLDHRADRLEQAEAAYRQVLTMCPAHADALHLLGIIALHMGRNDLAFDYIGRAIALHGTHQDGYSNLGQALRDFGLVRPDLSDAHNNFGHLLYARGQPTGQRRIAERRCACGRITRKLRPTSAMRCLPWAGRQKRRRATERLCGCGRNIPRLTTTSALRCMRSADPQRRR